MDKWLKKRQNCKIPSVVKLIKNEWNCVKKWFELYPIELEPNKAVREDDKIDAMAYFLKRKQIERGE